MKSKEQAILLIFYVKESSNLNDMPNHTHLKWHIKFVASKDA